MVHVNYDELIRRYAAGERNFAGVKLGGDLSGIDLSGADFSGNKMDEFSFERAILKPTSFVNTRLAQSCLDVADLTEADLRGARLSYAN